MASRLHQHQTDIYLSYSRSRSRRLSRVFTITDWPSSFIMSSTTNNISGRGSGGGGGGGELQALGSQIATLAQSVEGLRTQMEEERVYVRQQFQVLGGNVVLQGMSRHAAAASNNNNRNDRELLLALGHQISGLSQSVEGLRRQMDEDRVYIRTQFQMLQQDCGRGGGSQAPAPSRIPQSRQPAAQQPPPQQHQQQEVAPAGAAPTASELHFRIFTGDGAVPKLVPHPRNLFVLWDEYEHGIGNNRAARLFSAADRRLKGNRDKFQRRKVVWNCIAELVASGITARVAIDRIYQVYGVKTTVTEIINRLQRDTQAKTLHEMLKPTQQEAPPEEEEEE